MHRPFEVKQKNKDENNGLANFSTFINGKNHLITWFKENLAEKNLSDT